VRGTVKGGMDMSFRMIKISDVVYIGDIDELNNGAASTQKAEAETVPVDNQLRFGLME
jgi:hypothetical protein